MKKLIIILIILSACKKEPIQVYTKGDLVQFKEPCCGVDNFLQVRIVYPSDNDNHQYELCSNKGIDSKGWGADMRYYNGSDVWTWGDKPADKLPNKTK